MFGDGLSTKRVYKPNQKYGAADAQKLLDITFADDTSLLCRERARPLLEDHNKVLSVLRIV